VLAADRHRRLEGGAVDDLHARRGRRVEVHPRVEARRDVHLAGVEGALDAELHVRGAHDRLAVRDGDRRLLPGAGSTRRSPLDTVTVIVVPDQLPTRTRPTVAGRWEAWAAAGIANVPARAIRVVNRAGVVFITSSGAGGISCPHSHTDADAPRPFAREDRRGWRVCARALDTATVVQ